MPETQEAAQGGGSIPAPSAAAEAVASAVEDVAKEGPPPAASEAYIQSAIDRAEEAAGPYVEPLAARAKEAFAAALAQAEAACGAAAAHPVGQRLLGVPAISQAADAVAARRELALGVALGASALATCYVARRLLAPKADVEREPLVDSDEDEAEEVEDEPKVEGTLTLTPIVGGKHEVVLEEVVDSKGRRLILASEHREVALGARVTLFNDQHVETVTQARRAQAAVAPNEVSVLQLGGMKLELEPVEPEDEYEKKSSPVYTRKPGEVKQAQAALARKGGSERVNVTVSPPTESLGAEATVPQKVMSLEPTLPQNGHSKDAEKAEAEKAEAKAKAEAEAKKAEEKAKAEAEAKKAEEAKAKAEAEAKKAEAEAKKAEEAKAAAEAKKTAEEAAKAAEEAKKAEEDHDGEHEAASSPDKEKKPVKTVKKLAKKPTAKTTKTSHLKSLKK